MSSTGTMTWSSSGFRAPASTIATSRPVPMPPRNRAIVSSGRWVALTGRSAGAARRSPRRARAGARGARGSAPGARRASCRRSAWTSSTMTCSTPRRISRAWLVSRRYRLSGVVTRMSGGRRTSSRRSSAGVSPVRLAIEIRGGSLAEPLRRERDAGERGAEVALDVVGQRLQRARRRGRGRVPGVALGRRRARLADEAVEAPQERGQRLAAAGRRVDQRVLARRRSPPSRRAWACVGASNVASNQARTAGPNGARGSTVRATTGRRV